MPARCNGDTIEGTTKLRKWIAARHGLNVDCKLTRRYRME